MYEKIASDILGDVISHVNTLYSHEKTAAPTSTRGAAQILGELRGMFTSHDTASKVLEELSKAHADELASAGSKVPSGLSSAAKWLGGTAAVGIPSAYFVGKATQGANNEYDKMKYGLGGAALGLAAPVILSNLTGGKSNLGSLLNSIASPTGTNPDHQDFTSI
jgi:hypothetical protein